MMFFLKKPGRDDIQQFMSEHGQQPCSYAGIGRSRSGEAPPGYVVDHNRVRLGFGAEVFEQARAALGRWEMFQLDWVQLCWPTTPVAAGSTVGVLVRVFGLWSLNLARIVYLIDEAGPVEKFGFAYGTLPAHAERGEERFSLEWQHADDSVWYDIFAFSRPNQVLSQLGYPYTRRLQCRFALDSMAAMRRAVSAAGQV